MGGVISKFETKGFKLVAMKMFTPTLEEAKANYAGLSKLPFFPGLCAVRAFVLARLILVPAKALLSVLSALAKLRF